MKPNYPKQRAKKAKKRNLKYLLLLNQVESNKISVMVTAFTPYTSVRKINRKYNNELAFSFQ